MRDEDVVMTLLESLPPSYEYLITALETLPMQDLTMEFVTARLMHEVSKRKEKEPQGDGCYISSPMYPKLAWVILHLEYAQSWNRTHS